MALEVKRICKSFGVGEKRTVVLNNFSMRVEDGEMVAVVGKKKSGKTTLMNILAGLSHANAGSYVLDGKEVHTRNPFTMPRIRNKKLGILTKEPLLVQDLTVYENIMLPLNHRFLSGRTKQKRAKDLLRSLGMKGMGKYYPLELTELEQQKVCAARAMITEPKYLLLDEPTACLSSSDVDRFLDFLEVLNSAGYTIVIATHSKRVASRCQRMIPITGDVPQEASAKEKEEGEMPEMPGLTLAGRTGMSADADVEMQEITESPEELQQRVRRNLEAMGMDGEMPQEELSEKPPESEEEPLPDNTGKLTLEDIMEEELEKNLQRNLRDMM